MAEQDVPAGAEVDFEVDLEVDFVVGDAEPGAAHRAGPAAPWSPNDQPRSLGRPTRGRLIAAVAVIAVLVGLLVRSRSGGTPHAPRPAAASSVGRSALVPPHAPPSLETQAGVVQSRAVAGCPANIACTGSRHVPAPVAAALRAVFADATVDAVRTITGLRDNSSDTRILARTVTAHLRAGRLTLRLQPAPDDGTGESTVTSDTAGAHIVHVGGGYRVDALLSTRHRPTLADVQLLRRLVADPRLLAL